MQARMFLAGEWVDSPRHEELRSPWSGEVIASIPSATPDQATAAVAAAVEGARGMARLGGHERSLILNKAADRLAADAENIARTISAESGKPITEARGEAGRLADLLRLSAFEGTQLRGEVLPLDAQSGGAGRLGMVLRVPCGIVVAITPFNYPALLVMHKVGPALAAGNAVILKPASQTPLTALAIVRHLVEAGLPNCALQCITGHGSTVGGVLCRDERVRKISFTGSTAAGEAITRTAGIKRLSLELGSNCPMVVLPDADVDQVAAATAVGGYANAGQVCISLQRILVHRRIYADFLDAIKERVAGIVVGQPFEDATRLSAMISEKEARRVCEWFDEAVSQGARRLTGGERDGAVVTPTILADVSPAMRVSRDELFGPGVAVTPVDSVEEALNIANDSKYGLGASVFTRDVTSALRFVRGVESGNVHVNWTPLWRADLMPYGGVKLSGHGREGPRYAVEEMTDTKTVVIHGLDQ